MGNDGYDSGYPDTAVIPLLPDIAFPVVVHDEGERVNQSQHEHGPGNPVVPDVQLLVGDAGQRGDGVCFGAEDAVRC